MSKTPMNILLSVVNLVLPLSFVRSTISVKSSDPEITPPGKYSFIESVCDTKFPDLLLARNNSEDTTFRMFRLIPVRKDIQKKLSLPFNCLNEKSSNSKSQKTNFGSNDSDYPEQGNFSTDGFFLKLACEKFSKSQEIEELVYEMFVRFVGSFINSCTYPKAFDAEFVKVNFNDQELKNSPLEAFNRLVSRRETRDVVIIVLENFVEYLEDVLGVGKTLKNNGNNDESNIAELYYNHLWKVASYIRSLITKYSLISETEDRTITSKSFIMISSKYANDTGNYIIDATTFMDTTIPF